MLWVLRWVHSGTHSDELIRLHANWQQYRGLFGASAERVEFLNRLAGFFFLIVQDALWNEVLLHVARLTDSQQSKGRPNLSVRRLPAMFVGTPIEGAVSRQVAEVVALAHFVRDWRNKSLAHRDLGHALQPESQPLSLGSRQQVEDVLLALRSLFNLVEGHHFKAEMVFDLHPSGDVNALLYHLRLARDTEDARDDRLREHRSLPDDFKPSREA